MSFLVIDNQKLPFSNLQDLIKDTNFRIAVYPGSLGQMIFEESADPLIKMAWQKRVSPHLNYYHKFKQDWIGVIDDETAIVTSKSYIE